MAEEKTIQLEVITPEKVVFAKEVTYLEVPGELGYLGILPNHIPLVTGLKIGVLNFHCSSQEITCERIAVGDGLLEFSENKAKVLVHTAELGDNIDVIRAKEALERAKILLQEKETGIDVLRAELALKRAIARIKAAGK